MHDIEEEDASFVKIPKRLKRHGEDRMVFFKHVVPKPERELHRRIITIQKLLRRGVRIADKTFYDAYNAHMRSPKWYRFRKRIIQRADGRCEMCNYPTATFEVHHVTYENFGRELEMDVLALCHACHTKIHADETAPEL